MIIATTALKGGVGKSTVAQNLAVYFASAGYKVAIFDADKNQNCVKWSADRPEEKPFVFVSGSQDSKALSKNIAGLNDEYDVILIDGTPALNSTTSRILLVADMIILPLKAGKMDLDTIGLFYERYEEAEAMRDSELPAYFILNEIKSNSNIFKEAKEALKQTPFDVLETHLVDRISYPVANSYGLSVLEYKDKKAAQEITNLGEEIIRLIKQISNT